MRVAIYRRGRHWWARYHLNGRPFRRSLKTENRKVAEEARLDLELSLRRGPAAFSFTAAPTSPVAPATPAMAVAAFVAEYRDYSKAHKRPKTHATDMARLNEFIASLDVVDLTTVTTGHATRFLTKKSLTDKVSPTTILRYRETLHAFFTYAKRLSYVRENPISAVPRPRIAERDVQFLDLQQIDQLLNIVGGDLIGPLIATLIFAGLRREEVCWLTWSDFDLTSKAPCLRVCAKTIGDESWTPKTKRNRNVPISSRLLAILRALPHRHPTWVFASPDLCRWDPDNLSARFRGLLDGTGLNWNCLHLRHTFGSQLARKGVSHLKIAEFMGNSPEIARKHYIRLMPEELHADVEFSDAA